MAAGTFGLVAASYITLLILRVQIQRIDENIKEIKAILNQKVS